MAGKKNHYIPQFLLRGFSEGDNDARGKAVHSYSRSRGLLTANISDFAAERYFYSPSKEQKDTFVDDEITRAEPEQARLVQELRQKPFDTAVDKKSSAALVVHLCVRGAYARNFIGEGFRVFSERSKQRIVAEDFTFLFFDETKTKPSKFLQSEPNKFYAQNDFLLRSKGVTVESLANFAMSQLQGLENQPRLETAQSFMSELLDRIGASSAKLARQGHVQALTKSLSPDARIDSISHLRWSVMRAPSYGVVLPDCAAISLSTKGKPAPFFFSSSKDTETIVLPISSKSLLCGQRTSKKLDTHKLNQQLCQCSFDFFVGNLAQTRNKLLASSIGLYYEEQTAEIQGISISSISEQS